MNTGVPAVRVSEQNSISSGATRACANSPDSPAAPTRCCRSSIRLTMPTGAPNTVAASSANRSSAALARSAAGSRPATTARVASEQRLGATAPRRCSGRPPDTAT